MLRENPRGAVHLRDYRVPDYLIDHVDLDFDIYPGMTRVRALMQVRLNPEGDGPGSPLVLDGESLQLDGLAIDGKTLSPDDYVIEDEGLTITEVPERFELEVHTTIRPEDNTQLEGLYRAERIYCTQCEAEGFRKITYYLDRPDVMAVFSVRIQADRETCPVLLSNGNLVGEGKLDEGRHWARWDDPHPKPSYLFALVAGDLGHIEDTYVTSSGREVSLRIYAEPENLERCRFAMESLKNAMSWDEKRFGLECDLDNYNIVATNDFNMGAMENKGLNIFNAQYVMASPETATDSDYQHIEGVIGHEYFHNWTGNRVTCRDWFQLSLKEGLTVFRDQEFSADMQSRAVKRIDDVRQLRAVQFPEDAGPMAHPVRPESYIEINNFYTSTVYEKGAEVVRMYHTLLGEDGFRKGMDLYFERHDGQAVTCDDFCAAMADANDRDLSQFSRWYSQAGTPVLAVSGEHDSSSKEFRLRLRQDVPDIPGQATREPFVIPLRVGLLDGDGMELRLRLKGETGDGAPERVLQMTEKEQTFIFDNVTSTPVPSLLRGFSAPVRLRYDHTDEQLAFLMAHDQDAFNRWDAGQRLATRLMLRLVEDIKAEQELSVPASFTQAFRTTLMDTQADPALIAEALTLPAEGYLAEQVDTIDVDAIHEARRFVRRCLATELRDDLLQVYEKTGDSGPYRPAARDIARRRLRNCVLAYLMTLEDDSIEALCSAQYEKAGNMTDRLAALIQLVHAGSSQRETVLGSFYSRWKDDPLVLNKWFSIQASDPRPGAVRRVRRLSKHDDFNLRNPNRVRSLLGAFGVQNRVGFHSRDGSGYEFMVEHILELDPVNPQVASRLAGLFNHWRRFDAGRRDLQQSQLERLADQPGLSRNTYEIVSRALAHERAA